jgi:hypothetical protein
MLFLLVFQVVHIVGYYSPGKVTKNHDSNQAKAHRGKTPGKKESVWENVREKFGINKFNAIKNALAKDIRGYLEKAEYLGWRPVAEGKHIESAYFAYKNSSILTSRLPDQPGLLP